jgi:S-adenosylmethionine decarboxylase
MRATSAVVLLASAQVAVHRPRGVTLLQARTPSEFPPLQAHGSHALLDFEGFTCEPATAGAWVTELLRAVVRRHGLHLVHEKLVLLPQPNHHSPPGFTSVILLDESHVTAHCYSDRGWLAIDVFTCGGHDPRPVAAEVRREVLARHPGATCVQDTACPRFLHHHSGNSLATGAAAETLPGTARLTSRGLSLNAKRRADNSLTTSE